MLACDAAGIVIGVAAVARVTDEPVFAPHAVTDILFGQVKGFAEPVHDL
jgi:hypothetical protein